MLPALKLMDGAASYMKRNGGLDLPSAISPWAAMRNGSGLDVCGIFLKTFVLTDRDMSNLLAME